MHLYTGSNLLECALLELSADLNQENPFWSQVVCLETVGFQVQEMVGIKFSPQSFLPIHNESLAIN